MKSKRKTLAEARPDLLKEWNWEENEKRGMNPYEVYAGFYKKASWICFGCSEEWEATIESRTRGSGCPYCRQTRVGRFNNLAVTHPEIAKEWNYSKNAGKTPEMVVPGSRKKVWWNCSVCKEPEPWLASVKDRTKGSGCPYCRGAKVGTYNNLEARFPDLAKEWHPTKNHPKTPRDVKPGSNKQAWWKGACGHVWRARIHDRSKGAGCPYCAGKIVAPEASLAEKEPTLAKEWHPTKNPGLSPEEVTPKSVKVVWWQCERGHEWKDRIRQRSKGRGCPQCALPQSKLEIRMYCELRTLFEGVKLRHRIGQVECDIFVPKGNIAITIDGDWDLGREGHKGERDAALKATGVNHYRIRQKDIPGPSDGALLFSRRDKHLSVIKRFLIELLNKSDLPGADRENIREYLGANKYQNTRGYKRLFPQLPHSPRKDSLSARYPEITSEWNAEKNGPLRPNQFQEGSDQMVWWLCAHGHQWQATLDDRVSGKRCPCCAGNKRKAANSIGVRRPDLLEEWDWRENEITPYELSRRSTKKVAWVCKECGEKWTATVAGRCDGKGCPHCAGKLTVIENNLAAERADLAAQWHPTMNHPLTPEMVDAKARHPVWWYCKHCGREWHRSPYRRTSSKCPFCKRSPSNRVSD